MPWTKQQPMTAEQLERRVRRIVLSAMAGSDVDKRDLAEKIGRSYEYVCRRLRLDSAWTPADLLKIADAAEMSNEQILKMFGR